MLKETSTLPIRDHDLIIKLDTKVDLLTSKVDELSTNVVNRVDGLEKIVAGWQALKEERDKVMADHETRIRRLEYAMVIGIGIWMTIEAYLRYVQH